MLNFIIKTHRVGTIYTKPHLFILNKGMNSGKPQKEPFTNSFVLLFQNEDECESLFFIAYSLWKTKFWHQFLCGSVIPFLRLPDFKKEFFKHCRADVELLSEAFPSFRKLYIKTSALTLLNVQH